MSYGLVVWGSMMDAASSMSLTKVQKACLHIINGKKKNTPTDELFKQNKILKFNDMVKLKLIKFGYKFSKSDIPNPIVKIMNDKGGKKNHRYPMQNKAIPNIQLHNCLQFNNSYQCKGPSILGAAHMSIKCAPNLKICIKRYKQQLYDSY